MKHGVAMQEDELFEADYWAVLAALLLRVPELFRRD